MSDYAVLWGHQEGEPWDEEEAIRLLKEVGAEVAMYQEGGARMPYRERYHTGIERAYGTRNMEAYREAVNGYAAAAREAHRLNVQREAAMRKNT